MLHIRIAALSAIVLIELWNLTSALEAWAEGRSGVLFLLIGLQCAAFVLAAATWVISGRRAALRHTLPTPATGEPATAE